MGKTKTNLKVWPFRASGYHTTTPGGAHIAFTPFVLDTKTTGAVSFGDNISGWRHLIATNQNATTTMVGVRQQVRPKEGYVSILYPDGNVSVISGVIDQSSITTIDVVGGANADPIADAKARSKLLEKYIQIKSAWRGGNFLAEIAETIHMLHHPLKAFYHRTYDFAGSIGKLKKLRVARPETYRKRLADAWLAYVFGVKPLVNDVNDFAEALNGLVNKQFMDTRPIRAHGKNETVTDQWLGVSPTVPGFPTFPTWKQEVIDKADYHVFYYGKIKCRPQNANNFLLEQFGVSVFDIVPAVWEAIPWSFFIDYFVNVQEMLDSMKYAQADLAWLSSTYRNARTVNASAWLITPYGPTSVYSSGGGGYRLATRVRRQPQPTLPLPSWTFRIPGIPSLKWLNIAALSQQIRQSQPRSLTDIEKLRHSIKLR